MGTNGGEAEGEGEVGDEEEEPQTQYGGTEDEQPTTTIDETDESEGNENGDESENDA
ncbi:hypothetical protein [Natronobacterium lacisalsi]|nr:hypothetical protein [Halobiforma lacisalsi]